MPDNHRTYVSVLASLIANQPTISNVLREENRQFSICIISYSFQLLVKVFLWPFCVCLFLTFQQRPDLNQKYECYFNNSFHF